MDKIIYWYIIYNASKEKKKKCNNKKHIKQTKKNIIYQTIPNYSSSQVTGHQYNKIKVQFLLQQCNKNKELIVY